MATPTLNITLAEPFKSLVEARVQSGEFTSPDEYVQALIQEHQPYESMQHTLDLALNGEQYEISADELDSGDLVGLFRSKLSAAE